MKTSTTLALAALLATGTFGLGAVALADEPADFEFGYEASELDTETGEAAMLERLRDEARDYCREASRANGDRKTEVGCVAHLTQMVEAELEERDTIQVAENDS